MKKNPGGTSNSQEDPPGPSTSGPSISWNLRFLATHPFGYWFGVGILILVPAYTWFLSQNDWLHRPPKPIGDGLCYESIAFSLYSGKGFFEDYRSEEWRSIYENDPAYSDLLQRTDQRVLPATGRPPILPMMIASVYSIVDRTPTAFMLIRLELVGCLVISGAMAAGLSALLLHRVTNQIWISAVGASLTIGLAATQNTLKEYATDFLTEPIALFWLQTLITIFVIRWFEKAKPQSNFPDVPKGQPPHTKPVRATFWKWDIMIGICMGMLVLTRSMFIFWIPGLIGLQYLSESGSRATRLRWVVRAGGVSLLVCLPWWIHNCWSLGQFMPLGTQGNIALLGGFSDEAYQDMGNWSYEPELALRHEMEPSLSNLANDTEREIAVSREASSRLHDWIVRNPEKLPQLVLMRAVTHWNPYMGKSAIWKLLIVIGAVWIMRSYPGLRWWMLGLPVLSTLVVMSLYETGGRFLVPLYAHLFMLGGLSVGTAWAVMRTLRKTGLPQDVESE